MKLSKNGITLIKEFEKYSAIPYLCPAGVPTIGYGTTYYPWGERVTLKDSYISESKASEYLADNLAHYIKAVDSLTRDDITQNQFDALISICYNIGIQALKTSTLLKKVNDNPKNPIIVECFYQWVYVRGKKSSGLQRRRKREAQLYFDK